MSFFDDDDPPTRAQARAPRSRPAGAGRPRPRPAGGGRGSRPAGGARRPGGLAAADERALRQRRLIALGVGLLVVLLLILGISSCRSSARKSGLKDYNRDVAGVAADSVRSVATPLFTALRQGGQADDLQGQVNQLRSTAADQAKQARGFDVPSQMAHAQTALLQVLDFRAGAVQRIADEIPSALAQGDSNRQTAEQAVTRIAGQMEVLLASDVVYAQRVAPAIGEVLADQGISGQPTQASAFLPDVRWLSVDDVAGALGAQRAGGGKGADPTPAPGLHGHGLTSVGVGGQTLDPSPAVNKITASGSVSFDVKLANQGDFDESDVVVKVAIRGGGKTITRQKTVAQTTAKSTAEVSVPLGSAPPIGTPVTITVQVAKVPGETNTDNNTQRYTALFSR